jgi:UDP-galactopyranose mutase
MQVEYLVVGSGLTGATMARLLADAGRSVLVVERRSHLGGNVYDHTHASGIRVHTYGPHYFRTNNDAVWQFVNRFAEFYPYQAELLSYVDGAYEQWPVTGSYIRALCGQRWEPDFTGEPANFEEASLAMMPRIVYEKFVREYNEKQWGVPAQTLDVQLARRFEVRWDDEPRLMRHKYQGIPQRGYAELMRRLLDGIPVQLNVDYLAHRSLFKPGCMTIFTGPIDEYFDFDLGRLEYRGQQREHEYLPHVDLALPCGQVNNPQHRHGVHLRTLEWKHMMPPAHACEIEGTLLTRETTVTPMDPNDYEYPFPDTRNRRLYAAYRARARQIPGLLICGRLGEYRYYDMDQAIARAHVLTQRILQETVSH